MTRILIVGGGIAGLALCSQFCRDRHRVIMERALLNVAEEAGFEVLLTTDRRIRYQQNLRARRIALVVLTGSTRWSRVRRAYGADRGCNCCSYVR